MEGYNGWPNYETWNASMFIGNDEDLYYKARRLAAEGKDYTFLAHVLIATGNPATADGVKWDDPAIDTDRMNELMREL